MITFVYDMRKVLVYFFISGGLAAILAVTTCLTISDSVLSTLYTVAGVIFSVGMSIAITPKTEGVTNTEKRGDIRRAYRVVRNSFMYLFAVDTFVFISAEVVKKSRLESFVSIVCAIFVLASIGYYTYNFFELQRLGNEIEEQVLKEKKTRARHRDELD